MSNTIVVVGAGVIGLTSALLLSKNKGNKITVVAKHMPGDYDVEYASPFAGANHSPMATEESSEWERRTWYEFKRLVEEVPEAGVHFQKSRIQRRNVDIEKAQRSGFPDALFSKDPWFKNMFEDFREQHPSEVVPGYDSGCEFTEAKKLSHTGKTPNIIVNATGLGSYKLGGVEDKTMAPARGQIVLVRNESSPMLITSGVADGGADVMYLMQRAAGGGTILGGTYDVGNWESQPDPNIAARIMQRIVEVRPEIANGKGVKGLSVIRHAVGMRPWRKDGVRIEEEKLDDETWIVHNYGHSGWGYQGSYGCAESVVQLVDKVGKAAKSKL
ncbi:D-amino acid oxidase [Fusarium falciforme]|nr:D-amino acid oxidase [Fusarium falciforme]